MNNVCLMGRMVRDAEVRTSEGGNMIAKYTLAVDRPRQKDKENEADFISCTSFGKTAEFLGTYGKKGTKFVVQGRIQTGSYTNKDGQKVYTTDVIVSNLEFAESKRTAASDASDSGDAGFASMDDEELPFN